MIFDMSHAIGRLQTLGGAAKLSVQERVETAAHRTVVMIAPKLDMGLRNFGQVGGLGHQ